MPIDPTTGAVTADASADPGDLSKYGFSGFGGGGLLGDALSNPLFNFGVGLLSQGPSLTPQSGVSNIGKAFGYASEAQQRALENQIRRQSLLQTAQQQQGLQRVQDLIKTNPQLLQDQPLLGALLATGYPPAVQGVATALADPNYGINLASNRAKLAGDAATNVNLFNNASAGEAAVDLLAAHPGSESLIKNPSVLELAQLLKSGADVMPQLKKLLPTSYSDKDAAAVLDAASTLVASKDALVAQGGIVGDTSNVGLDFYKRAFGQAKERAVKIAAAGGKAFDLPSPPLVAFGETPTQTPPPASTAETTTPPPDVTPAPQMTGFQNGRVVSQPAPVVNNLPPDYYKNNPPPATAPTSTPIVDTLRSAGSSVANTVGSAFDRLFGSGTPAAPAAPLAPPSVTPPAASAAPEARKVSTVRVDTQGRPMYRSEAEFNRDVQKGKIPRPPPGQQIIVNIGGMLHPWPVTQGTANGNQ